VRPDHLGDPLVNFQKPLTESAGGRDPDHPAGDKIQARSGHLDQAISGRPGTGVNTKYPHNGLS